MLETQQFTLWLFIWLVGLGITLWSQRKASSSVGLVLAYALQLWVIHWLAPSIYALPWYIQPSTILLDGLKQSTYAILGFGVGASVIAPFVIERFHRPTEGESHELADRWLMRSYLWIGVIAYIVQPFVRPIPTVGALMSGASNLLLVAFAMECWNGLNDRHGSIWRWIGLAALLPFVTIVTQGFLSYGFAAMLTVFAFVASIYRPRWRVLAMGAVVSYLALSMYVTYMRDRQELRAVIWGQESYSVRLAGVVNTFSNFEFLDLTNLEHLQRIDDRLNQDSLVGAAVQYLALRPEEFANGSTIWEAILSPIPRALWPDKPMMAGSGDLVTRFTGIRFAEGTSVGIGHVMEWYVNFGTIGVLIGSTFFGVLIAFIDAVAASHLRRGYWTGFALWYLPALSLLQVGGSLVEAVSSAGAGLCIGLLIQRMRPSRLRRPTIPVTPGPRLVVVPSTQGRRVPRS